MNSYNESRSPSPNRPKPLRLFIAIILDQSLQDSLTALLQRLSTSEVPVKWLEPGNLHLTLCFLGDVPEGKVPQTIEFLNQVRLRAKPFEMKVGGLGGFPTLKKPRVLFTPVTHGWEPLRDLAADITKNLRGIGEKQDDREFNAHITLGRVKGFKGAKAIAPALEGKVPELLGQMKVESFALVQSELKTTGSVYTVLEKFNLSS